MNVSLRDVRHDDAEWLDTWLGPCAASVGYDTVDTEAPSRSLLDRIDQRGLRANVIVVDMPVGVATYRVNGVTGVIEFVGVEPQRARRGYGHAGAVLVEEELRAAGVERIFAAAPAIHGIDVYFWIRLGYRPLQRGEWPCERRGTAWLARDLR